MSNNPRTFFWHRKKYPLTFLSLLLSTLSLTPCALPAAVTQAQDRRGDEMAEAARLLNLSARRLRDQLYTVAPLQGQQMADTLPLYQAQGQMVEDLRHIFWHFRRSDRRISAGLINRGAASARSQLYPGIFDDLRDLLSARAPDGRSLSQVEGSLTALTHRLRVIREGAARIPGLFEHLQREARLPRVATSSAGVETQAYLQQLQGLMPHLERALRTLEGSQQALADLRSAFVGQRRGMDNFTAQDLYMYRTRLLATEQEPGARAGATRLDKEVLRREGKDNSEGYEAFYQRIQRQIDRLEHQTFSSAPSLGATQLTFAAEIQELIQLLRSLQQAWQHFLRTYPLRAAALLRTEASAAPTPPPDAAAAGLSPKADDQPGPRLSRYLADMRRVFRQAASFAYAQAAREAAGPAREYMKQLSAEDGNHLILSIERVLHYEPEAKLRINGRLREVAEALENLQRFEGPSLTYPNLGRALECIRRVSDQFPHTIPLTTPVQINYVLRQMTADLQRVNQDPDSPEAALVSVMVHPSGAKSVEPAATWRPAMRAAQMLLEKTTTEAGAEIPYLRAALLTTIEQDEGGSATLRDNVTSLATQVAEIERKFPGLLPAGAPAEARTLQNLCLQPRLYVQEEPPNVSILP